MTVDRNGRPLDDKQENASFLRFLYGNPAGRVLLRLFTSRFLSRLVGGYMNSRLSSGRAKKCMKAYGVKTEELEKDSFRSFNEFFTRKKKPEFIRVDADPLSFPSPADSRLTVVRLKDGNAFPVKGAPYTAKDLLSDEKEAEAYRNGWAFVFRLAPSDYHRYVYPDGGTECGRKFIPGVLHTVSPVATDIMPVCHRNCREETFLETDHFGRIAFVEVGAMMVGKICNRPEKENARFERGEEKGYFAFGGSTIVVLFRDGSVLPDGDILKNSNDGNETYVRLGESVAKAACAGS
ncbi:MAG: phosphatidylserine decarboxylase [Clostridia bacterium]|nr:phosphatidylserine decarboxylase [Clostridia bacterium]